jgi:anti-sigma B factor antagonist
MQIQRRMVGPVVVLDVSGRMVLSDPGSDAQFKECINGLIASGTPYVIVNVGAVTDIDTSGLSALVSAHISMASTSTRLKLTNPTTRLRHLLHVTRLDAVFDIAESEEQALAAFTGLA